MTDFYEIELSGNNPNCALKKAKISLTKINHITQHKWYMDKNGYAFSYINGSRIPLHRYVWFLQTGQWENQYIDSKGQLKKYYIDHINRDRLDNTDQNLRLATPAENSYNKTSKNSIIDPITNKPLHHIKLKKSGYEVSICKDGTTNKINQIKSLEEAKEIYNIMATELFGNFAVLY